LNVARFEVTFNVYVSLTRAKKEFVGCRWKRVFVLVFIFIHRLL